MSEAKPSVATSSDEGPAAASDESGGGMVVAGKPFYPEVTISYVETPSKFYVMELSKKDALDA